METSDIPRALAAGISAAAAVGLKVTDAIVVHASNRIAVHLLPGDVLARVAYGAHREGAEFEVEVARCLAKTGSPVARLDPRVEPRVHLLDGFAITLWAYYESLSSGVGDPQYAQALVRLHAGMTQVELMAPHFTDRVGEARSLLADRSRTPELGQADRELLDRTLQTLATSIINRAPREQLLHGEPHPGNLLNTRAGPLFVDLETCCRGPVEFDIAHAPAGVADHYPDLSVELLSECRVLMLAMITTWRWDRDDRLPNGRALGREWLSEMRAALDR